MALAACLLVVGARDQATSAGADGDGPGPRVAVAARDLEPGTVVADGDVRWRTAPDGEVPASAITQDESVAGRVIAAPIEEGEVLTRRRLAPDGARGVAALVPAGAVGVAIARDAHTPDLEVGQRVDVLTTAGVDAVGSATALGPPGTGVDDRAPPGLEARRVARNVVVVDVGGERVVVAIPAADAPAVAAAVLDGAVVLAITGSG